MAEETAGARKQVTVNQPFALPPNTELINLTKGIENARLIIEKCEINIKRAKLGIESLELDKKRIDKDILLQHSLIESQEQQIKELRDGIAASDERIRKIKSG